MALVTLTTFHRAQDAELARMALEAEGIQAVVLDDVRVQVDERDVDDADAILNRMAGVAGAELVTPSDEQPWEPPQTCPSCGAPDVARRQKWVAFFIVAAFVAAIAYVQDATLLGFYIVAACLVFFLIAPTWRCRQCGHTW
jgi:hypothetical protein